MLLWASVRKSLRARVCNRDLTGGKVLGHFVPTRRFRVQGFWICFLFFLCWRQGRRHAPHAVTEVLSGSVL